MNCSVPYRGDYILKRWDSYEPLSDTTRISLLVIMSTTLVVGSIGNALVLVLFSKFRSLRTTANMFVINLTVGDLLICVLCLPVLINNTLSKPFNQNFGYTLCNIDGFLGAYVGFVSILSLAALAIDRCNVINRKMPIMHDDDKTAVYVTIAVIWLFAGIGASLPLLGFGRYVQDGSQIFCTFDFFTRTVGNIAYNITIQVVYFILPMTSIITCYSIIFVRVRSHERKYFDNEKFDEASLRRMRKNRKFEKNDIKTAKAGFVLIVVFCVSWMPYCIICIISLYGDSSNVTPILVGIPAIFAKLSTILNPIFYALIHKRFKRKLKVWLKNYVDNLTNNTSHSSKSRQLNCNNNKEMSGYNSIVLAGTKQNNVSAV